MDLPVIPLPRDARCPLHPPAEFEVWRNNGLQQAMWHGQLFWVVNRYSDIRAALTDPRVAPDSVPSNSRSKTTPTFRWSSPAWTIPSTIDCAG